jgi:hypothetical protein
MRIGVRMRISGAMSIRVPSISSRMLIASKITYLLSESDEKKAVTFIGICIRVRI